MLFFQALILAGYTYTHFSLKKLGIFRQSILQFLIILASLFFLPLKLEISGTIPTDPSIWLLIKLFKTTALPFFLLATLSPLLQVWFSRSSHADAGNPFFLYASSNIGSFVALLAFPLLIEPSLDINHQSQLWLVLFALLLILIFLCRWLIKAPEESPIPVGISNITAMPDRFTIQHWIISAFIPSTLLLGVTFFLTSDLAPIPLLWVVPLMIYLATFAMAFSGFNLPYWLIEKLAILAILIFPLSYFVPATHYVWVGFPFNLFILFSISLYCHSYLAKIKPGAEHLTSFYTWISFGGMLGGFFNSIIAPNLFSSFTEYPLAIVLTCLLMRSISSNEKKPEGNDVTLPVPVLIIAGIIMATSLLTINEANLSGYFAKLAMLYSRDIAQWPYSTILRLLRDYSALIITFALVTVSVFPIFLLQKNPRPRLFILALATILTLSFFDIGKSATVLMQTRNFFGKKTVKQNYDDKVRTLTHGSTMHGVQKTGERERLEPLSYYHSRGPAGDIFNLPIAQKPDLKVCIIGLGIGSMAAYSKNNQEFNFIEIDPDVISMVAETDLLFTYITDNASRCTIIQGDGRFKLLEEPEEKYDIIFVDAFSSDSIPVHLLTAEAIDLYLSRIKETGLIAFNVSNRYLKISKVLHAVAHAKNLTMLQVDDNSFDRKDKINDQRVSCEYVVLTRSITKVKNLLQVEDKQWVEPENSMVDAPVWTDSYSSLLPILYIPAFFR